MNRPLRIALFAAAALVLAAAAALVARYEHIITHGEVLRLELAPIDPRSLLQGDYMRLRFALDSALREHAPNLRPGDVITVQLDEQHRARLPVAGKRPSAVDECAPAAEESVLRTQALIVRDSGQWTRVSVGPNAFFFRQGTGKALEAARWGELRVAPDGTALLVRLLDENLQPLGTQRF